MQHSIEQARQSLRQLGALDLQLSALAQMDTPTLIATYEQLYGEPTRSRNRDYLRKRLQWRVQELAKGGLPQSALDRIASLGDELPERWRQREAATREHSTTSRDPRMPPVGSVLRRIYQGICHEVVVEAVGFVYRGERFKSLSAVAKRITGKVWNGYTFFAVAPANKEKT